jgi:hypothetical protein
MEPTKELLESLYRERVLRARRMSPQDKLLAGARLFDYACRITMAGIRSQHPDATPEEVLQILKDRLDRARRREERA